MEGGEFLTSGAELLGKSGDPTLMTMHRGSASSLLDVSMAALCMRVSQRLSGRPSQRLSFSMRGCIFAVGGPFALRERALRSGLPTPNSFPLPIPAITDRLV